MEIKVCSNISLDLSKSYLNEQFQNSKLNTIVRVNGVGVFDDNGRILPLISQYLSYFAKHEKISDKSANTYGKNLTYFLQYIRNRSDYSSDESDDVFLTVPSYVIQEYLTCLSCEQNISSSTVRNRDATIRAFIDFLCSSTESRIPLRQDNPYERGYLSKAPKRTPIVACNLDDLFILITSTLSERERVLLQFLYDSGLRRSELPRVSLEHIQNTVNFNSQTFISDDSDKPISPDYAPLEVLGSKGRGNELKPRWSLISSATIHRIQKYHASPLYKKHARKYSTPSETPAFLNAEGTTYTPSAINKLLKRLSSRAIKKGLITREISPHKLRHGNAYAILQSNDLGIDYLDRLVILQKNLGHNHLNTTQMYTSIPHDIYNSMCNENGELLTRAEKMRRLTEKTQLRISIKDIK